MSYQAEWNVFVGWIRIWPAGHKRPLAYINASYVWYQLTVGSVYFSPKILAATDQLELLCRQSNIRPCGMTQFE